MIHSTNLKLNLETFLQTETLGMKAEQHEGNLGCNRQDMSPLRIKAYLSSLM